jgi:hypothetical protein
MQLCGSQEIEQLRFEKQQIAAKNVQLTNVVKQRTGLSVVLLSKLAQQQSSSCSSISVLAQAVAQQTLQGATLFKALQLKHQREVSAVLAGLWAAGTAAAALCGPWMHHRPTRDCFISLCHCMLPAQHILPAQTLLHGTSAAEPPARCSAHVSHDAVCVAALQAMLTAQLAAKDQTLAALQEIYAKAYEQHNIKVSGKWLPAHWMPLGRTDRLAASIHLPGPLPMVLLCC